jgi:predicted MFS family arabinose efflux permease
MTEIKKTKNTKKTKAMLAHLDELWSLPVSVKVILVCAMARALSAFTLLPYLPIYLKESLGLNIEAVGYLLGAALLCGTLASLYGGYLADKVKKTRMLSLLALSLTCLMVCLPEWHDWVAVGVILVVMNTLSSTMGVTNNALLGDLLPSDIRGRVFSLRYSLENIGAATGPFLGLWLVRYQVSFPFWVAAAMMILVFSLLSIFHRHFRHVGLSHATRSSDDMGFAKTLHVLHSDKRLVLFTLAGIFSIAVYGPLLTYLSQYLISIKSSHEAYQMIACVSGVNAVMVISLQYVMGSRIDKKHLLTWLMFGSVAFLVGLLLLSFSTHLAPWLVATVILTLGEIVIVPAEYMFIDAIAPEHLKGAYFGAQNLICLGMAIGPVVCGVLLRYAHPQVMFYSLMGMILVSMGLYAMGCRHARAQEKRVQVEV